MALTITKSGTGTGAVTSTPAGINCGTSCSTNFSSGTSVTLTATPAAGSYFAGWSGACNGMGSCAVAMTAARNVTATFNPVPFIVTPNITNPTPTTISVTTQITFNPPDLGKSGAVFITGWVPLSALSTLGITSPDSFAIITSTLDNPKIVNAANLQVTQGTLAEADANSYVLVQKTATGWKVVINGQLIPYATGVLGDLLASQTILDNLNTSQLIGTQFCLGYGTSADEMTASGRMLPVAFVADPNATAMASGSCLPPNPKNYSDSWYNQNESGWGITITDHGSNAFVQWYTYDELGHNQKYVISGGTFSADKCLFSGSVGHVTGPSWTLPTFDPTQVVRTTAGSGTINFCPTGLPVGTIVFNYTVGNVTDQKELTRLPFGNDVPHQGSAANTGGPDFTDLWYNPAESGWGVSVTQHGNNIFFRIFVYDTDGRPLLLIVPGATFNSATSFTGQIQTTTGPWFGNPFDPTQVIRTPGGTATLTFSDASNGTLSYPVNGTTVTKAITRLPF